MGARVGDICYASQSDAADVYYSAQPGLLTAPLNGSLQGSGYSFEGGKWVVRGVYYSSNGTVSTGIYGAVPLKVFPSCTYVAPETSSQLFTDGTVLGWGVLSAMAAVWGLMYMRRAIS
jgi:hypothetical protein